MTHPQERNESKTRQHTWFGVKVSSALKGILACTTLHVDPLWRVSSHPLVSYAAVRASILLHSVPWNSVAVLLLQDAAYFEDNTRSWLMLPQHRYRAQNNVHMSCNLSKWSISQLLLNKILTRALPDRLTSQTYCQNKSIFRLIVKERYS